MAGVKKLRRVQGGLESAKGTAHAATFAYRGVASITDNTTVTMPDENIGYLAGLDRAYIPAVEAGIDFPDNEATFEQIGYPLSASVKDTVTGTVNGTLNGYSYDYTAPTTSQPTTKSYTWELGDDYQAYKAAYGICQSWSLKGEPKKALMMSSKWIGRQMSKATFTGGLTPAAVEEILFAKGKIYLDAVGGTLGATQLTNTWLGFDLTYDSGIVPVYTGDGNLYYSFDKCIGPKVTGSFTFEHDSVGVARYDDYLALTTKKIRMAFLGSLLTGTGGTYTNKLLQLDAAIKLTHVDPLGEVNGNDILKVTFEARYNTTATLFFVATVVNMLTALP